MEAIALALALTALIFSVAGFAAGTWACVQVLGWKRSTHKIEYRAPVDSTVELDLPERILEQLPVRPNPQTVEQYLKEQRENGGDYLLDQED